MNMSRCNFISTTVLAACLLLGIVTPASAARSKQTPAEDVPVVTAVASIFPRLAMAARVSGAVVVLVKVDAQGKVVSADAVSGHPLLRGAAREAAILWRFAPAPGGLLERSVWLTFLYTLVLDATEAELAPTFSLPYKVEVRYMVPPHIDVNVRPTARKRSKR
jgi:TonB family protein